jgi:hypothetical protein
MSSARTQPEAPRDEHRPTTQQIHATATGRSFCGQLRAPLADSSLLPWTRAGVPPDDAVAPRGGCCTRGVSSGVVRTIWSWPRTSLRVTVSRSYCYRRACASGCRRPDLPWFVLDAVAEMDLAPFYSAYRDDGHGRAAHDPAMMVALLLYAYAVGRRSSRVIERACVDDVGFRVIAANQRHDHCTIARFASVMRLPWWPVGDVLALCEGRWLVWPCSGRSGQPVAAVRLSKPQGFTERRDRRRSRRLLALLRWRRGPPCGPRERCRPRSRAPIAARPAPALRHRDRLCPRRT